MLNNFKESIEADFKGSIDPDLRLFEQYAVYDKKGVPSGTRLTILYGLQ
jgi:hypothetical protein